MAPKLIPAFVSCVSGGGFTSAYRPRVSSPCVRLVRLDRCWCSRRQEAEELSVHINKFRETFSKRMAQAGLEPHHRIALGVSGGPDSMALCVLAAEWKTRSLVPPGCRSGAVDGLLAIVVDHNLRVESKEEANLVRERVSKLGISCEVAHCQWKDGRPDSGRLQVSAREMRYEMFHKICSQHGFGILLLAHHADDQAELFVLRLSRNSGVLGLAGMAFTSQIFSNYKYCHGGGAMSDVILLVRPLLDFSKDDLYKICRDRGQEWVEDPSNQSSLFVRNRIRKSLMQYSSSFELFGLELQALISSLRRTRAYVDHTSSKLIEETVMITETGYAVIDLSALQSSKVDDMCLAKFISMLVQFISQRHRPIRANSLKLLLSYLCSFPCETSLTVAGCYLCPAPGSKGTKVLVCCSVNCPLPSKMEFLCPSHHGNREELFRESKEIVSKSIEKSRSIISSRTEVDFMDASSESILCEARRLHLISESTLKFISSLQQEERDLFKPKSEKIPYDHSQETNGITGSEYIKPGQTVLFMNRFLIEWELSKYFACNGQGIVDEDAGKLCIFCASGHEMTAKVRPMMECDWLYLAELTDPCPREVSQDFSVSIESGTVLAIESLHNGHVRSCARMTLQALKSIPVAARRSLPVLVNLEGVLLSIPSLCFKHCPCLQVSARFNPIVPLGGGHSSFI
ncbi:hypothetical protein MLD38_019907 [Melastoma candidum]|uniref:Uncharacterized protein n=1 Tax=Melastoma candidum TaxID=119954 RepID=A0ACB9QJ83_9MYRT|nr:hypothetical protein MLD38_019907 [Melastoma candidum]